jgi:hypothetical protein
MKNFDLSKLIWSKCRVKILEKLILEYDAGNNEGFHMRLLARDLDEQINSIKRELDNLEELWVLKSRDDNKKKVFYINKNFFLLEEFKWLFIKTYDPFEAVKKYFKSQTTLDFVLVNDSISDRNLGTNCIVDIFLIWEIDKIDFNNFLAKTFFNRKIKYAIITVDDFYKRLEFSDKLIYNILTQNWNTFLKDSLKVLDKFEK